MSDASGDDLKLAVMPFKVPDDHRQQRYFAAGVGEDILDKLDACPGVAMAPRATVWEFRDSDPSGKELRRKLGVEYVIGGEAYSDDGELRIKAHLRKTEDGEVLWTKGYQQPSEHLFAVIVDICKCVGETLSMDTSDLRPSITKDVGAFDFFLRGLDHSREFGLVSVGLALDMFQLAAEADPDFALAHAGVAECSVQLYLSGERTESNKQRALDASAKAVELMPSHPRPHIARASALFAAGESEEGMASAEQAIKLDPESFDAHYNYAREAYSRGDHEKAMKLFKRAQKIRPEDYQTPMLMSLILEAQERKDDAMNTRRRGLQLAKEQMRRHPYDVRALYMGANALVALGEKQEGLEWAKRAETIDDSDPLLLYNLGCIHALSDDIEVAIDLLEKAVDKGYTDHGWMAHDDDLEPLHGNPRFDALLGKMGKD